MVQWEVFSGQTKCRGSPILQEPAIRRFIHFCRCCFFLRLGSVQHRSRALTWAPPGKRLDAGGHPKMRHAEYKSGWTSWSLVTLTSSKEDRMEEFCVCPRRHLTHTGLMMIMKIYNGWFCILYTPWNPKVWCDFSSLHSIHNHCSMSREQQVSKH